MSQSVISSSEHSLREPEQSALGFTTPSSNLKPPHEPGDDHLCRFDHTRQTLQARLRLGYRYVISDKSPSTSRASRDTDRYGDTQNQGGQTPPALAACPSARGMPRPALVEADGYDCSPIRAEPAGHRQLDSSSLLVYLRKCYLLSQAAPRHPPESGTVFPRRNQTWP